MARLHRPDDGGCIEPRSYRKFFVFDAAFLRRFGLSQFFFSGKFQGHLFAFCLIFNQRLRRLFFRHFRIGGFIAVLLRHGLGWGAWRGARGCPLRRRVVAVVVRIDKFRQLVVVILIGIDSVCAGRDEFLVAYGGSALISGSRFDHAGGHHLQNHNEGQ